MYALFIESIVWLLNLAYGKFVFLVVIDDWPGRIEPIDGFKQILLHISFGDDKTKIFNYSPYPSFKLSSVEIPDQEGRLICE